MVIMRSLLLIPTAFEKAKIDPNSLATFRSMGLDVELCGFGLIASTAQATRLITQRHPDRVILAGIAGLYRTKNVDETWIGKAAIFDRVVSYGIGVGSGLNFTSAGALGWSQLQSEERAGPPIDMIALGTTGDSSTKESVNVLVSVTAASADYEEASGKLRCFPDALAEDMEGFGVAIACQLCEVPLSIARGFSNWVGDRDHKNWKVSEAMESVCKLLIETSGSLSK
jgi:futalosine hydrolase